MRSLYRGRIKRGAGHGDLIAGGEVGIHFGAGPVGDHHGGLRAGQTGGRRDAVVGVDEAVDPVEDVVGVSVGRFEVVPAVPVEVIGAFQDIHFEVLPGALTVVA